MGNQNALVNGDLVNITTAILAGGLGTRLRSAVSNRPKVLAEVRGRPFLAYLLDQLTTAGLRNVILCTGYLGEEIQAVFGNSYGSLSLSYSQEGHPLGTGGALRLAMPLFNSYPILVMNGDSFCQVNLSSFYHYHHEHSAVATLVLTEVSDGSRYGRVHVDANGLVVKFDEKDEKKGPGRINAGVYLMNHQMVLSIPADCPVSLEREVFPSWIGRGLYGYSCGGRFLDIGTPEEYEIAERFFTPERPICNGGAS